VDYALALAGFDSTADNQGKPEIKITSSDQIKGLDSARVQ
jgi:hypothetical protein